MLLRAILRGDVWNGFLLGKAKKDDVPCRFCGKRSGDGRWSFVFGSASFPPLLRVTELPELATLVALDRSNPPRCLLWHGWLPGLSGAGESDPWATSFGVFACCKLECRLVAHPGNTLLFGPRLNIGMLMILLWKCLILLIYGW